jgi:hypothetical protein
MACSNITCTVAWPLVTYRLRLRNPTLACEPTADDTRAWLYTVASLLSIRRVNAGDVMTDMFLTSITVKHQNVTINHRLDVIPSREHTSDSGETKILNSHLARSLEENFHAAITYIALLMIHSTEHLPVITQYES